MGPTVCELDGPMPTLNKSKTETATLDSESRTKEKTKKKRLVPRPHHSRARQDRSKTNF
jgi:hypothetical protein